MQFTSAPAIRGGPQLWLCSLVIGVALSSCGGEGNSPEPVPTDTIAPQVLIAQPSSSGRYTATTPTVTISGTASDNVGVTRTSWTNNRGASGSASGTSSWSVGGVALQPGDNIITISSEDAAGNRGTASITVTRQSSGSLDLPRIAWEGGPAYYDKFPQAKARGWADPNFFPIAVWGATVENDRDISVDKDIGLNTYLELYGKVNFEAIRRGGMSAIHGQRDPAIGDESVGWFLADEPEQFGQSPGQVLNYLRTRAGQLPNDGRLRFTNFTGNMIFPNFSPGTGVAADWIEINDVTSLDIYWYARDLVCSGSIAGEIWKDGSGARQPHGGGYNDLSMAECHRSSNYGYQVEAQRRIAAEKGKMEPVWTFVENGDPFEGADHHEITPDQMAGAIWSSLIHEARGVVYFNTSFNGCVSSNNFRHPVYYNSRCYVAMRARAKLVNDQIRQLAPVLNTQSYLYSFNGQLDTMLKEHDGAFYIFAMPGGIKGGSATGRHRLKLPPGLNGSTVEVLFEGRTIPIDSNREFADSFDAEYSYHIYRIRP